MLNKGDIKRLFRSGSLRFARDCRPSANGSPVATYRWRGAPIYFRPGTSDPRLIYNILLKRGRKGEYWVPSSINPRIIFDIGGNIGIASIYFANLFPRATIYVFEPVPANFSLLKKNVTPYPNVRAFPFALGDRSGTLEIFCSDDPLNEGGYSFHAKGIDQTRTKKVEMRGVREFLRDQNVGHIDLINIDTEGSEFEILTALGQDVLASVKWITGELHGQRDFELLAFLSQWLDVGLKKSVKKRIFNFVACNKNLVVSPALS